MAGAVVGRDCNLGDHAFVESGARLGNGVTLKNGVAVWDGVTLEDFVFVGPCATFTNDRHPRSPRGPAGKPRYATRDWLERTVVKEGATIGANATVVCGVTVGRYALVAAGAVVTRDVADFGLVAGCPAVRKGWVCQCGRPLPPKASPKCGGCGRAYRRAGGALRCVTAKGGKP
jgi:UDP-2-acetamido-3-amino-2,3-dideoxy-glucuronate N-acetyltransferase